MQAGGVHGPAAYDRHREARQPPRVTQREASCGRWHLAGAVPGQVLSWRAWGPGAFVETIRLILPQGRRRTLCPKRSDSTWEGGPDAGGSRCPSGQTVATQRFQGPKARVPGGSVDSGPGGGLPSPSKAAAPAGPLQPPARLPKRHPARVTLLACVERCPRRGRGDARRPWPFPGSYLEQSHKNWERPPLRLPGWSPSRAVPTPLAEVQGERSLQLNQRINRGLVPQTRGGSLGH